MNEMENGKICWKKNTWKIGFFMDISSECKLKMSIGNDEVSR